MIIRAYHIAPFTVSISRYRDLVNPISQEGGFITKKKQAIIVLTVIVFLLALGLLTLILGLMPPKTTDVIIAGAAAIIAGLLEFALARGRTPPRIPASCKKEARKALELRRTVDWEKLKTAIRFEDAGITICAEENEEHLSYTRIKYAFESLHLWLVVCDDECALLLQKKDLRSGNADSFLSDIISKMNTGTDASG